MTVNGSAPDASRPALMVHASPTSVNKRANTATATAPWTEKYQYRIGSQLSPQYVTAVGRNADAGSMAPYADLLDELRETDPHLDGVLFKRCAQVAGAKWQVVPTQRQKATRKRDKAVEFATEVLSSLPGLQFALFHLMNAAYHGRAAVEVLWRQEGAQLLPECFYPIHPRRLSYTGDDFELRLYDDSSVNGVFSKFPGVALSSFVLGKFLTHCPSQRGAYPTREGIGRVVQWYSLFKRWTQRDWMAMAELAGRPGRVGYFGTGGANPDTRAGVLPPATPDHVDALALALEEWTGAAFATLPDTVRMDFVNVAAGYSDLHEKLVKHCNSEMSKAVLGSTLTTDPGERGARSLGDTQQAEQRMIAVWDAKALSETITRQLVKPLIEHNFPAGTPVPLFVLNVEPEADKQSFAQYVETLSKAGLNIPQSWVRQQCSIPDPAPGEPVLIPREPVEVDAAGVPINTDPASIEGDTVKRADEKPEAKRPAGPPRGDSATTGGDDT